MKTLSRRHALFGAAGLGVAVTYAGAVDFAAADQARAQRKLVIILLRGAMDGLAAAPPLHEANYAAFRGKLAIPAPGEAGGALKLDRDFALHPRLERIHALASAGQARIAPAIATPHRGRSHFDGQDVLESGAADLYGASSGWLNRALVEIGQGRPVSALSVGDQTPLILRGPGRTSSWAPGRDDEVDANLTSALMDLYAQDELLGRALAAGLQTRAMADAVIGRELAPIPRGAGAKGERQAAVAQALGESTGKLMAADGGPSLVAVNLYGFDTHYTQGAAEGLLAGRLDGLDGLVTGLRAGLGERWSSTMVVAATEFGRTVRINGTGGTDHGTASTAIVAGGAVRPGGIIGDWPGLSEAALLDGRDLRPALDMRALFKGVLAEQFGVSRSALDARIFPNSGGVAPVTGLVA